MCICFCAYKIYKELQRLAASIGMAMSVDSILSVAKTITTLRVKLPKNKAVITKTMLLTEKQRSLEPLFTLLGY